MKPKSHGKESGGSITVKEDHELSPIEIELWMAYFVEQVIGKCRPPTSGLVRADGGGWDPESWRLGCNAWIQSSLMVGTVACRTMEKMPNCVPSRK